MNLKASSDKDRGSVGRVAIPGWAWTIIAITLVTVLLILLDAYGPPEVYFALRSIGPVAALLYWPSTLFLMASSGPGGLVTALEGALFSALVIAPVTTLYVLPWVIAERRHIADRVPIVLIDVFLGWTLVGWFAALVMASRRSSGSDRGSLPGWAWIALVISGLSGLVLLLGGGGLPEVLFVGISTVLYLVPWIVAERRDVKNRGPIIVINLFLGWTLIGWVIALAMAVGLRASSREATATNEVSSASANKTCPQCAEEVKAAARVCRYCGHEFVERTAAT